MHLSAVTPHWLKPFERFLLTTDSYYDSLPRNPRLSLTKRFAAARHEEGCYEKQNHVTRFLVRKGRSNDDVAKGKGRRIAGDTAGGAGFNTGDFVKEL